MSTARAGALSRSAALPDRLSVVGVTWPKGQVGSDDTVQVRYRTDRGWSAWEDIEKEMEGNEVAADTEGKAQTGSSIPVTVRGSQVQVRVVTTARVAPQGVKAVVIDPGTSPADATVGTTPAGSARADSAKPSILSRASWGADESIRQGSPGYGQVHMAIVHHTAGANGYSSGEVPAIIRGIYAFHVRGNGWSDIGYNVLVDRFGRAWEGRAGGLDKAVIGAQSAYNNSHSFGISMIGNYSSLTPSSATRSTVEKVIAWKFSIHGIPAKGSVTTPVGTYSQRIIGHRNAYRNSTSCPGNAAYALLPTIRNNVERVIGRQYSLLNNRNIDGAGLADVLVEPARAGAPVIMATGASTQPVQNSRIAGTGWQVTEVITTTPDFTGDGRTDIITRDLRTGGLRIYHGDGKGGFLRTDVKGRGWQSTIRLLPVGDLDRDGNADLIAVRSDGLLAFYPGDGAGWVKPGRSIGSGWNGFRAITVAGDLSGDGLADLLAIRSSDNTLWRYDGRADGTVASGTRVSYGWGGVESLLGAGDLDGDGSRLDLLARQSDGTMRTYYSAGTRILARHSFWGRGWSSLDNLNVIDWNGDGTPDILGRLKSDGSLRAYDGTGARDFDRPARQVSFAAGTPTMTLVRNIGDVDGDRRSDAVGRDANGTLWGLRAVSGGYAAPVRIMDNAGGYDLIEGAGDWTRDGVPDLLVRSNGSARVFALGRDFSVTWSVGLGSGWGGMRSIAGPGSVNTDYNADIVALRASDGALVLYRGGGAGSELDSTVIMTGQTDLVRILGLGDMNGNGVGDLVGIDNRGRFWIYPDNGRGGYGSRQPMTSALPTTARVG